MEKTMEYHVNEVMNSFKRGTTEMLLLSLLDLNEMYTYDLSKQLKKMTKGQFDIQGPSLYTVLYRMEARGYVTTRTEMVGKRRRVYYHLEDEGREYLRQIIDGYRLINGCVNTVLDNAEQMRGGQNSEIA